MSVQTIASILNSLSSTFITAMKKKNPAMFKKRIILASNFGKMVIKISLSAVPKTNMYLLIYKDGHL